MRRNIAPVAKKLGIGVVGWHALRHLYSTIMDEERVPVSVRRDRLGHTTARTTMIYTHGRAAENRRASHSVFERYSRIQKAVESETQQSLFEGSSPVLGTTLGTTPGETLSQVVENRHLGP